MHLSLGNGGWVRVDDRDRLPGPLYARLRRDGSGRWRVNELYLSDGPITGNDVRRLPIAQLEALAADPDVSTALMENEEGPAVPLSVLASYYKTTFPEPGKHWVADAYYSQIPGSGVRKVPLNRAPRVTEKREAPVLRAPEGGRLTDEFLAQVHRAYAAAIERGEWPAPALAEQTGVSRHAVRKWIYTARRRGIMPPGRQGTVG